MSTEQIINQKRPKEICPECHQKTLIEFREDRPSKQNPLKMEQFIIARCENCGYTSPPKKIDTTWLAD